VKTVRVIKLLVAVGVLALGVAAWPELALPDQIETGKSGNGKGAHVGGTPRQLAEREKVEQQQAPVLVLTVGQCVARALAQNPRVLVAAEEVAGKRAVIGQARAQKRPQVSGQLAFTRRDVPGDGSAAGALFTPGILSGIYGDEDTRTGNVAISQLLYAGGEVHAAVRASTYLAESEEWRGEATRHAVAFEAKTAYYDVLLAQALRRVAEESVATFQRHLGDAQERFNAGVTSQFEVLRAKTELGARQADVVSARNLERLALANLRRILVLPQDTPLRFAQKLDWRPLEEPPAAFVATALTQRPECRALDTAIRAAEKNVQRIKGRYLPRLAATADWRETDGAGKAAPDGWTFALGAEWEFYAGGRRKHEAAEATAQVRALKYQLADIEALVELEVCQAVIQVEDAIAKIESEKGTVALAREGLRLAELRFQEGVGIQSETLDAELALTSAESALARATRDYAVASAALEKAMGTNPEPQAVPEPD